MYENIAKVRQRQIAWAEQVAKHMLTLDDQALASADLPEEVAAFRAALASEHAPFIVIAAMDCLANTTFSALAQSNTPTPAFVLVDLFNEMKGSVHFPHGDVVLDAHTTFNVNAAILEFEVRFDLYEGRSMLFDALAHVLSESPPPTWGIIEFRRHMSFPNLLSAKLVDAYVDPPET